ncbi:5'-methylthioadenosine/adenosylhomocysteine nucleosidase [Enterococcus sp. UD-01]|uniref:5'-methylthioadenosine/adenosylhomocysteine nucleosidase n=1 Tax=Enterococcus sp. UD-01 TaxID=3373911 RepID=UPI0038381366
MRIVIATAMKEELAPFRSKYQTEVILERGKTVIEKVVQTTQNELFLMETGIGKVNAAAAASLACEQIKPELILNTGSAGGFSDQLAIGDVVYATDLLYSDVDATGFDYAYGQVPQMPASYPLAFEWQQLVDSVPRPSAYQLHQGLIVTADSFMSEPTVVKTLKERFPKALASDMESTAIAQIGDFYNVPVLNIRGISDIAGQAAAASFDTYLDQAAQHAFEQTEQFLQLIEKK